MLSAVGTITFVRGHSHSIITHSCMHKCVYAHARKCVHVHTCMCACMGVCGVRTHTHTQKHHFKRTIRVSPCTDQCCVFAHLLFTSWNAHGYNGLKPSTLNLLSFSFSLETKKYSQYKVGNKVTSNIGLICLIDPAKTKIMRFKRYNHDSKIVIG